LNTGSTSTHSLKPDPNVVFERLEDDLVLVHLQTNQIYVLNETAARFWELLTAGNNLPTIIEILCEEYDISPTTLENEAEYLVDRLVRAGLVYRGDGR
jgi:hypothetical protein